MEPIELVKSSLEDTLVKDRDKHVYIVAGVITAVLLLLLGGSYSAFRKMETRGKPSSSPFSTSSSAAIIPQQGSKETPTTIPPVSASPSLTSATVILPDKAQITADAFFDAYKRRDNVALEKLFTADMNDELKSLHSTLFKGVDLSGNPGGPTLFSTNSADQSTVSYEVVTIDDLKNGKWVVVSKENRVNGLGKELPQVETKLTLIQSQGSEFGWLVDEYAYTTSSGKYSAFLLQ